MDRAHEVGMAAMGHQQSMQAGEADAGVAAGQQAMQQSHEAEQAKMAQEAAERAAVDTNGTEA
jgi:hypothetical protein